MCINIYVYIIYYLFFKFVEKRKTKLIIFMKRRKKDGCEIKNIYIINDEQLEKLHVLLRIFFLFDFFFNQILVFNESLDMSMQNAMVFSKRK